MHGGAFFLPGCTIGEAEALPYYDDLPDDIRAKYRTAGSLEDWQELCRLAKRNSRMILALALQFVGPLGGLMPIEFVGVQLVGVGGTAKTAIGVAASSVWGWDPVATTADRVGFGSTWNSTVNNLERVFAGYNQTALFLDETRASSNGAGKRANEILDAIMKIERSIGKGRLTEPGSRRWFTPLLSTSNVSVVGWLRAMFCSWALSASGLLVRACKMEICARRLRVCIGFAMVAMSLISAGVGSTRCICTTRSGK